MLRIRRLSGFLLGLLLVQITILGAGVSCLPELVAGDDATTVAAAETVDGVDGHADRHAHHGEQESPGRGADGHDPTHCIVSMACALASLAGREVSLAQPGLRATAGVIGANLAAPRSLRHAPEPPPPRG